MRILVLTLMTALIVSACGRYKEVVTVVERTVESNDQIETNSSLQDQIYDIIEERNAYRDELGQAPYTEGLTCTVHNAANGDLDVSFGPTAHSFTLKTSFNMSELMAGEEPTILPEALALLYVNKNYSLRCQGQIVITESKRHSFTLNSDDGSRLWVNGKLIIDNEGNHSMTAKTGTVVLERGVYSFRLDYSQSAGGKQGLLLTDDSGEIVSELRFYR